MKTSAALAYPPLEGEGRRAGTKRSFVIARRGGVRGGQSRVDRLRMNNHPTPIRRDPSRGGRYPMKRLLLTLPWRGRVGSCRAKRDGVGCEAAEAGWIGCG